jgi:hypothetical protein
MQNLEDQKRQNKQQYTLIKKRQKILSEKTKNALGKLEDQKDAALKAKDNVLYDRLLAKEKKIRKYYRERKEELSRYVNFLVKSRQYDEPDLNKS